MTVDDWRETNRAWWDERALLHVTSAFYDVEGFRAGRSDLRPFELDELDDVNGRDLVHLHYDAPQALGRTFDIVYTGIGALCWLPDEMPTLPLLYSLRARRS